jgi:predicted DNA-binding transcriptional regulator AlpA
MLIVLSKRAFSSLFSLENRSTNSTVGASTMANQHQFLSQDRFIELQEVTHVTSLKKNKIYELINVGELRAIKLDRKTVF